jgi:hypothetical protein
MERRSWISDLIYYLGLNFLRMISEPLIKLPLKSTRYRGGGDMRVIFGKQKIIYERRTIL